MDKAVSSENAHQFIKMLVELGGVHYVDQDHIIHSSADDTPVGVLTGIPKKRHPIAIFKEGMSVGDYVVLNPFTDILGQSPERAWFTNKMCAFPGALISHIVCKMIERGISKEKDTGYKANKYISKWIEHMDEKLLEEARRLPPGRWASIYYDRTERTAQLQSDIGYEELKKQFSTKIRKASWPVFVDMLKTLLQLNNKKPESLIYESKVVSIPKIDAILHLLIDILDRLSLPISEFTEIKIPVKELKEHLKHLEAYREATKWFASATNSSDADQADASEVTAPWSAGDAISETPVAALSTGGASTPASEAADIASLTPVGVIYNSNFGRPQTGGMSLLGGMGMGGAGSLSLTMPGGMSLMDTSPSPISNLRPW